MPIKFQCTCGKLISAPDGSSGRRARCPRCSAVVTVPEAESDYELSASATAASTRAASGAVTSPAPVVQTPKLVDFPNLASRGPGIRAYGYVLLLLALIPLITFTFKKPLELSDQIEQTIAAHPEIPDLSERILASIKKAGLTHEGLLAAVPNHRLEGALLGSDSSAHWLMGLAAAVGFLGYILLAFPRATRYVKGMIFAGLFTATAGIILLLVFQWAAFSLPFVRGRGVVALIMLIVKLIGMSYAAAENPDNGFVLSFVGFTCGVGLCEEVTKLIPLLFRVKPIPGEEDTTWNSLLIWGLASGAGFGIAEGIMYSSRYYNGIQGLDIYLVRFLSCVALHAIWAGSAGIILHKRQQRLSDSENGWMYCFEVLLIVLVPMILHGLYDTLLKKGHDGWALLVAVVSFAFLAGLIESMRRKEPEALVAAAA